MQIKLIALSSNELVAYSSTTKMISNSIAQMTNTTPADFTHFSNHKDLFMNMNEYFQTAEIIILAVDLQMYISTKGVLFKALGIKCEKNDEILSIINSDACISNLNETQANAHAAIPYGAEAFITKDGLFSGFGIKSNNQKLIMIPIDDKRLLNILTKDIRPFITEGLDINFEDAPSNADIEEQMHETLQSYPVFTRAAAVPSNATATLADTKTKEKENAFEMPVAQEIAENTNPIAYAIEKMQKNNSQISFAKQNNNLLVEAIVETNEDIHKSSAVRLVKVTEEKTEDTEESYKMATATVAKNAKKSGHTQFGGAVSPVFKDGDGNSYIFSALADEEKASVFKIYALENEKEESLVTTGVSTVFEALSERLEEEIEPVVSNDNMIEKVNLEKQPLSLSIKVGIWLIIVITICTVIALIINYIFENRQNNSAGQLVNIFASLKTYYNL